MPTVCRWFPGFRGWAGWGTSLIYTCLRGGSLPGSPGRSCGRPEGLVLLPIWPPRGPAHASTLTSLCYLPGIPTSQTSCTPPPQPATHPSGRLPLSRPVQPFAHGHAHPPPLRLPLISGSICLSLIIRLCSGAFHSSSIYLATHPPCRPFTHFCVVRRLLGGVLASRACVFGTQRTCWLTEHGGGRPAPRLALALCHGPSLSGARGLRMEGSLRSPLGSEGCPNFLGSSRICPQPS